VFFFYLLLMFVYWTIGVIMPRSGNDYVWVARIFGPAVGFPWAMVFVVITFGFFGYAAGMSGWTYALGTALTMWGTLNNSQGLINAANWVSSPMGGFSFVVAFAILFALLTVVGAKAAKAFIYVTWVASAAAIITIWSVLGTTTPAIFAAKWDLVLGHYTTYESIFTLATKNGWTPVPLTFAATMASMPFAVLFLLGGNVANVVAGEIKGVRRAIPIALICSLIFSLVLWVGCNTFTLAAVGDKWMYALGYLWDNAGTAYSNVLPIAPTLPLIVFFTMLFGSINVVFISFWLPSRYIFAWAFDRIIPTKCADVNARFRTPHVAIALITIAWIFVSAVYWFTSFPTALTIGTLLYNICFAIVALGCVIFPFTKKDLLAQAPGFLRKKIAGVPLISIVGLLTAISFLWIAYISAANPLIVTPTTYGVIIAVGIVVGCLVIYYASYFYHKRRGLDISLVFKEIPPV
jgi:amino acid transporter